MRFPILILITIQILILLYGAQVLAMLLLITIIFLSVFLLLFAVILVAARLWSHLRTKARTNKEKG